jgi:hypothetical protein
MAIFLIARSKARTWRILGWFACILALTLLMVEAYGWHRRGDWQIKTAFDFWNEMQRSSLIWLNNQLPSAIWQVLDFLLHFPAWLVLGIGGILLLLLDHRQVQKQRIGAKPAPLLRRLKDWLFKPQEEEADQA